MTNIKTEARVHIANRLKKIVGLTNDCEPEYTTENSTIFNRTLKPVDLGINVKYCNSELDGTIFAEVMRSGVDKRNIDGTILRSIIDTLLFDAIQKDIFRFITFGRDKADVKLPKAYRAFDGLITKLLSDENYGCVTRGEITSLSLDDTDSFLQWAIQQIDTAPRELSNIRRQGVLLVTPNLYDNLENYYLFNSLKGGGLTGRAEDGVQRLFVIGVEVIPISQWEEDLTDPQNPLTGEINTISVFTIAGNHWIGTDNTADLDRIEGWYDRKDKLMYFQNAFRLDYQFAHCAYNSIYTGLLT
jgi:hypothetical protein